MSVALYAAAAAAAILAARGRRAAQPRPPVIPASTELTISLATGWAPIQWTTASAQPVIGQVEATRTASADQAAQRAVAQRGYLGGTSGPRMRSFSPLHQKNPGGGLWSAEGLAPGIAQVELPWCKISRAWDNMPTRIDDLPGHVLTVGAKDSWVWILFDADEVMWLSFPGFGVMGVGDPSAMAVGVPHYYADGMDAEHQLTGKTAETSQWLWEVNAPRIVRDGPAWKLAGFGAEELAAGRRQDPTLSAKWATIWTGGPYRWRGPYSGSISDAVGHRIQERGAASGLTWPGPMWFR